ncbi:MAG: hypothetical protein JWQ48_461 [Conexibacter sp.]|nr:hypothetical protein [Conexibacter sp.]
MSHASPHRRRRHRSLAACLLASAATALGAATDPDRAEAGTYTVYTCKTPSGVWTGMEGWASAAGTQLPGHDYGNATGCAAPSGVFSLQYGSTGLSVSAGSWIGWTFAAPVGTTIGSLSVHRAFNLGWPAIRNVANRPYVLQGWFDQARDVDLIDFVFPGRSGDTVSEPNPLELRHEGVNWRTFSLTLRCWDRVGQLDCASFPAQVTFSRATLGLRDATPPQAYTLAGSLVTDTTLRGNAGLTFEAADEGGGVYRSVVSVDGAERSRHVVDANDGRCADVEPGNADAYEFASPQPCSTATHEAVALDTTTLVDGQHTVRVAVEDAAGNLTTVHEDTFATHNGPIATQPPALAGAARVGATVTASSGQWDGAPTGYGYRWLRCDAAGEACAVVAGATASTYAVSAADAYHRLAAEVVAANASGAGNARSAVTEVIADEAGRTTPPAATPAQGAGPDATTPANGGSNAGGDGRAPAATPPPLDTNGIHGLANPLAGRPGHVANGTGASEHARLRIAFRLSDGGSARRVTSDRTRRWTIAGRLLDEQDAPIAGARLGAAWRVAGRGWVAHSGVRSGRDGRFAYVLPAGPTRAVELTYVAFSDSRRVHTSNAITEAVRAPVAIGIDRTTVTGRRVVTLRGGVGGEAIPAGGVLVTLQGYQRGWGWRTFRTVRTSRSGHWSTRYRFRLAHGRFAFRALVPQQGTYPFVTTYSRAVTVVVA